MDASLFPKVAAEWGGTIEQIAALAKVIEDRGGSMTGDDHEDLTLAAGAYSRACTMHECTGWLPFNVMPGWEDDVFCLLENEDAWHAAINENKSVHDLARSLRTANK